jgi:hypothetical protein
MSERLTDDDNEKLMPLMIKLAEIVSPPIAQRLRFAIERGVCVRAITVQNAEFDLVKLARFVKDQLDMEKVV